MSVCILTLKKEHQKNKFFIRIHKDKFVDISNEKVFLDETDLKLIDNTNFSFPLLKKKDFSIVRKMFNTPTIRVSDIGHCYTGEIDLTIQKKYLTNDPNDSPLIKGAIIDKYIIRKKMSQGNIEYLDSKKYLQDNKGSKSRHHENDRIVMQAITGVNEKIRLKMTIVDKGIFCANSVNYIIFNDTDVNFEYLLALLNSSPMNFLFSKTSTNSNVNGYEIDNLPIIFSDDSKQRILAEYVGKILNATRDKNYGDDNKKQYEVKKLMDKINKIVYDIYGLTEEERKIVEESFQ